MDFFKGMEREGEKKNREEGERDGGEEGKRQEQRRGKEKRIFLDVKKEEEGLEIKKGISNSERGLRVTKRI